MNQLEATGSSKILVTIYQTTLCHSPEDRNLHSHHHNRGQLGYCDTRLLKQSILCPCPTSVDVDVALLPLHGYNLSLKGSVFS
jgi:hypothetical protein